MGAHFSKVSFWVSVFHFASFDALSPFIDDFSFLSTSSMHLKIGVSLLVSAHHITVFWATMTNLFMVLRLQRSFLDNHNGFELGKSSNGKKTDVSQLKSS